CGGPGWATTQVYPATQTTPDDVRGKATMSGSLGLIEVFISYSHKDQRLRDQLETHLSNMKRKNIITAWHDRKNIITAWHDRMILPETEWKGQIDRHLESAQVILLLVSADFLASDYCYDVEMERALERHESGEALVIPVILRPCDWGQLPFGKLQALPTNGRPVTAWRNRDAAFADVVLNIERALEQRVNLSGPRESTKYSVMLSARIDDVDPEKLDRIMVHLREIAGDAEITLRKVEEGSVVLFLEGTQKTAEILEYLINTGMLKDVYGWRIKGVGLSPDPPEANRAEGVDDRGDFGEIRSIEKNGDTIRRILEQLRTRLGVIPFVGAGLSIPSGFPGWTDFLITQAQAMGMQGEIAQMLKSGLYEEAAEELERALSPFGFKSAIEDAYGDHVLVGKEISGAVRLIPRLARGPVITTNFDHILERVFDIERSPFELIVCGARPDLISKALQQHRRQLIKLHGDWEESMDRILTKKEYQVHYGGEDGQTVDLNRPLPRMIKTFLTGRALLFLGCSLNRDRTVQVLERTVSESPEIGHYAIVE